MVTPADIEREHRAAMLSISPKQHTALRLNAEAATIGDGRTLQARMHEVFRREADRRNLRPIQG